MIRHLQLAALVLATGAVLPACSNGDGGGDVGPPIDAFVRPDIGPCASDTDCPGSYCNPGSMRCCEPADPPYEICGDHIDQNCDHHDESCGDQDHDGVQACMTGQNPIADGCDCDDERMDVRPRMGNVAGAPELCDGIDNDCNGRIDESAMCCAACMALGATGATRADTCTTDGQCDCAAEPGVGPCPEGEHCCTSGCSNTSTDVNNCGFCEAPCTSGSDRCEGATCHCGPGGDSCVAGGVCMDGMCPMM